jgi:beta-xylosidase
VGRKKQLLPIARAWAPLVAALSVTCAPLNPENPFHIEAQSGKPLFSEIGDRANFIDYHAWSMRKVRQDSMRDVALSKVPLGAKSIDELYTNPVWQGYFADPFVLRHNDEFYAFGTADIQQDGRWFPILHSKDLLRWNYVGGSLTPLNEAKAKSYRAPEVVRHGDKYYMYYSAGGAAGEHHQIRVATAKEITGPYVDQGVILIPDEPFTIDPHPFEDPLTGKRYLFFAKDFLDGERPGTGIAMVELGDDMVSIKGEEKTVVRAQADWQIFERNRHWLGKVWHAWHTVEGPTVLYRNGQYYCFYSGGCWNSKTYGVGFAHAESINGPWIDDQDAHGAAVLSDIPQHVFGPGHNSIITAPDGVTDVIVYHAWDPSWTARRICLDRLRWTEEGPRCQPTWQPSTLYVKARLP